jgi:MFS transporter, ACS family, tartrate transporter
MDDVQSQEDSIARSAMPKVYWRILPIICLAYLCAYMDRVNVSFAAVQMNVDLEFSATIYGLGGGLFFLGYALFEVPSNLLLVRFGARPWLARIMVTWGLLAAGMLFVQTPTQFYVMRFLLGVAEAGFFPGVIYYFAGWFPAAFRGRAVSSFYVASPLASIVMGGISGWLLDFNGVADLRGWQWLFLVQGLPSVVAGVLVLLYLPDAPAAVKWLSEPEKKWLQKTLAEEAAGIGEPSSHNVFAAFRNTRVLMLGVIAFLMLGATTSFTLSAPAVLMSGTGLDTTHVGYLVSAGGLIGAFTMLLAGWYSDNKGDRLLTALACTIVLSFAYLTLGVSPSPTIVVVAYLLFASTCFTAAMLIASSWADVIHVRELAVGAAAINTLGNIGAFVMPYGWGIARDATGDFRAASVALAITSALLAALIFGLRSRVRMTAGRTALAAAGRVA